MLLERHGDNVKRGIAVGMLLAAGLLTACGGKKAEVKELKAGQVKEATLLVKQDGTVQSAIVEEFDKDYYKKDELKSFMEAQIQGYNSQNGADSVVLKESDVKDGKAIAVFGYKDMASYIGFYKYYAPYSGVEGGICSVEEAKQSGALDGAFTDAEGNPVTKEELVENEDYSVVSLEGQTLVQTESEIAGVSGAELEDGNTARVSGSAVIVCK